MTKAAFTNAFTVDMAIGGSTNTILHLPAIAREVGIELDLNWINEISRRTPHLCHLRPGGPHHIQDLDAAGGIPAVMATLAEKGLIDASCRTVTGRTVGKTSKGSGSCGPTLSGRWITPTTRKAGWRSSLARWRLTGQW